MVQGSFGCNSAVARFDSHQKKRKMYIISSLLSLLFSYLQKIIAAEKQYFFTWQLLKQPWLILLVQFLSVYCRSYYDNHCSMGQQQPSLSNNYQGYFKQITPEILDHSKTELGKTTTNGNLTYQYFFPPFYEISFCVRTADTVMCLHTWCSPAVQLQGGVWMNKTNTGMDREPCIRMVP